MTNPFRRTVQCKACPWRKDVDPHTDIPGGYDSAKHRKLCDLRKGAGPFESGRLMACHESPREGAEYACVGWLDHELGPGNNIGLRMDVRGKLNGPLTLIGEQHACIEDTLGDPSVI
jgi:hypothetical protein